MSNAITDVTETTVTIAREDGQITVTWKELRDACEGKEGDAPIEQYLKLYAAARCLAERRGLMTMAPGHRLAHVDPDQRRAFCSGHRADRVEIRPFSGSVAASAVDERPSAHGNIRRVELCDCGASRSTNVNQHHIERGVWV